MRYVSSIIMVAALAGSGNFEIIVFGLVVVAMLHRAREGLVPYFASLVPADAKRMLPGAVASLPARTQPAQGEALIELRGIGKRFGALAAVKDLSFELRAGEILGLVGPNGAGKSTVFNVMTGVLSLDQGEIFFRGARLDEAANAHHEPADRRPPRPVQRQMAEQVLDLVERRRKPRRERARQQPGNDA